MFYYVLVVLLVTTAFCNCGYGKFILGFHLLLLVLVCSYAILDLLSQSTKEVPLLDLREEKTRPEQDDTTFNRHIYRHSHRHGHFSLDLVCLPTSLSL